MTDPTTGEWLSTDDHSPLGNTTPPAAAGDWLSTDTTGAPVAAAGATPAQPGEQVTTRIRYPQFPTSFGEAAKDTGDILSRTSEGMGSSMIQDFIGAIAGGDPGARDRAKEHIGNFLLMLRNEPQRAWQELGQSGQSMVDVGKRIGEGDWRGAVNATNQAVYHGAAGIPVFGAPIKGITDEVASGHYKEGAGDAAALLLSMFNPETGEKQLVAAPKVGIDMGRNLKALEAQKYLISRDPVLANVAAATDSPFVRGTQKLAQSTPGGAWKGEALDAAAAAKLNDLSQQFTERAHPGQAMTPESAGVSMDTALTKKVEGFQDAADRHYGQVRAAEANPQNIQNVQTGWEQVPGARPGDPPVMAPVFKDVGLPVDLRPFRAANRAAYKQIGNLMTDAQKQYSQAYTALRNIMENHDFVIPASSAEQELGAIKGLARDLKDGRGKGLAKFIVPQLQSLVDDALSSGVGNPGQALESGRAATAAKYGVKDFIDSLKSDQSVKSFYRLVQPNDANIELLQAAQKHAPGEMRKLGRAWLQDTFSMATGEGGFDRAKRVYNEWQNLGPSTKRVLFDPGLASELDKFFLGAKKIAENPNPSGSATNAIIALSTAGTGGLAWANPLVGGATLIGQAQLARLFHSSVGVRLLTEGLTVPIHSPRATTLLNAIRRIAGVSETEQRAKQTNEQSPPQYAPGGLVDDGTDDGTDDNSNQDQVLREIVRRGMANHGISVTPDAAVVAAFEKSPENQLGQSSPPPPPRYQDPVAGFLGSSADQMRSGWQNLWQPSDTTAADPKWWDRKAQAASDVYRGAAPFLAPLAIPAAAAAPLPALGGLAAGLGATKGVQTLAENAGVSPGRAALMGDVSGLAAGAVAPHVTPTAETIKAAPSAVQDWISRLDTGIENKLNYAGGDPERGSISRKWVPGKTKLADINDDYIVPVAGKNLDKLDVMNYLQGQVQRHLGAIDPNAPPKVKLQRLLKLGRTELTDQLNQPNPNLDFYLVDTPQANADMIQLFPELATDSARMNLTKAASAALAQGSNPGTEAQGGGRAYNYYRQFGRLPEVQPNDGIPGSEPGKQWSTTAGSDPIIKLNKFIDMFKSQQDPTGLVGLERILTGRYPVAYLKHFNPWIDGKAGQMVPGAMILGPKIGSYFLDISGIPQEGATVDMWDTLAHHRRMGNMFSETGKPIVTPSVSNRQIFQDFHRTLENEFGLDRTQSQSGLWHYEKELYKRLGVPTLVKGRSDGTKSLLDAWGHQRQNVITRQNAPRPPSRGSWIAPQIP